MSKEWSKDKKWNPFNSYKLLSQVYRWREIKKGAVLPPSLITVDPINRCNFKCSFCNAHNILESNSNKLSDRLMRQIPDFLGNWSVGEWNVEAVCIAGGGEPTLHTSFAELTSSLSSHDIEYGVVSNGSNVLNVLDAYKDATWVGISVDAGTAKTFKLIKKVDMFDKVISNIEWLTGLKNCKLAEKGQGNGVSYKYLLTPENVGEVYEAASIAKSIGCRNFHCRPVGTPWDKIGKETVFFEFSDLQSFNSQIDKAQALEDDSFGCFGITHKFDSSFDIKHDFSQCWAVFMTFVIMPGTLPDTFNLGTCCDRRGDPQMLLGENLKDVNQIAKLWGSDKHWDIHDKVKVNTCPRCTYQPHNQIYEHVIEDDNMTYKFI